MHSPPRPAPGGGRVCAEWARPGAPTCGSPRSAPPTALRSVFLQEPGAGWEMNGAAAARGSGCAGSCLGWGERGRQRRALRLRGPGGAGLVAGGVSTCAGTCVCCLEAGVRVSRGRGSVPVSAWGVQDRMEWCVRAGHADTGVCLSGEGVCSSLEGVAGLCREGCVTGPRTAPWWCPQGGHRSVGGAHSLCTGGSQGSGTGRAKPCPLSSSTYKLILHSVPGAHTLGTLRLLLGLPPSVLTAATGVVLNLT